jgi:carnitine O-acetyltransferase
LRLALKVGEPVPELFDDPLYRRSGNWVLSDIVPEGFAVAYMTGYEGACWKFRIIGQISRVCTDRLQFTITSRKEMPNQEFIVEIARAAVDLYDLHVGQAKAIFKL